MSFMPRSASRVLVVAVIAVIAVVLTSCSSSPQSDSTASASSGSSSSASADTKDYPVAADGSVITPSGYVYKATFAICNQAKCQKRTDGSNEATCACAEMKDSWALSPIPLAALTALTTDTQLISAFTTDNLAQDARSSTCSGGAWADCYGAVCKKDAKTGAVTCNCPYTKDFPGKWSMSANNCDDGNCTDGLSSGMSIVQTAGIDDYFKAREQLGAPATKPKSCGTGGGASGIGCLMNSWLGSIL